MVVGWSSFHIGCCCGIPPDGAGRQFISGSSNLLPWMYRQQATTELVTSEILPSEAAQAPQNSCRRSLRTHRKQRRWPDSPECQAGQAAVIDSFVFESEVCAMFHLAWAEDRATVGTDPSADPGAKTEGGRPASSAAFLHLRYWHQSDKSRGSGGWPPVLENCLFRFFKFITDPPSDRCRWIP